MATLDELHAALQKADAAGDTEAAKAIAKMYAAQQSSRQQTQAGGADTMRDSAARGLPPLTRPNIFGLEKPVAPPARPISEQWQQLKDFAGGGATGLASGVFGIPGSIEALGRTGLNKLGANVSPENVYTKTPESVGNFIAGPAANADVQQGRQGGELISPLAWMKGGKALGNSKTLVRGSGTSPAATEARAAGYVVPPNMAQEKPSVVSKLMSGCGGKVKIQQAASEKNQEITNVLAARELGVDPKAGLSDQAFKDVRAKAGQTYGDVSKAMPVT